MWAGPDPLLVLHVSCDGPEKDLLPELPSAQAKLMHAHHIG